MTTKRCVVSAVSVRPHLWCLLIIALSGACTKADTNAAENVPDASVATGPKLISIGPRLLSNQTSQPITVTGEGFSGGLTLLLGEPLNQQLKLTVLDEHHAYGRLPAHLPLPKGSSEVLVPVTLAHGSAPKDAALRFINDTSFPDLTGLAMSPDGSVLAAVSGPTDTIYLYETKTKQVKTVAVSDGPAAIASFVDAGGASWFAVVHQFAADLTLMKPDGSEKRTIPAPGYAAGLTIDPKTRLAFVAEHARDTVMAISLDDGKEKWRTPVAPNPRELQVMGSTLAVGSLQTGEVELLEVATGAVLRSSAPDKKTAMLGPATREMRRVKKEQSSFSSFIMGGKAPRALAWSPSLKRLFVASIGPNVGPNPDKMEVSMNGGVASVAVDAKRATWQRHLAFGAGVTDALVLDEKRGLLYAADQALGLIRVLDAKKLGGTEATAKDALLQEVALPPPADFPLIRPAADFAVEERAGVSLHSGPRAMALSPDGKTLWVLSRFTGTIAELDVSAAPQKKTEWKGQTGIVADVLEQKTRRLGQVQYFSDLGRTSMSCDACHLEGHTEGVFFEKTMPLRIYRSPTVRGSRETPPYFTPASTHSMGETSKVVGNRNRYHNPDLLPTEAESLTLYSSCIPTLPNPFLGADGAPVEALSLPNGKIANPRAGLALFEGKAECSGCHPAPHYTMDQDVATRGRFIDVGTPHLMPLREAMQNPVFKGFGTPALAGAWDTFPMLTTGLAGLEVGADEQLKVSTRFALEPAVMQWPGKHGRADLLSEQEKLDLLAFVMSL